jgi:hypothetical protein
MGGRRSFQPSHLRSGAAIQILKTSFAVGTAKAFGLTVPLTQQAAAAEVNE